MESSLAALSVVQIALLTTAVVGAVEAIKQAFDRQWRAVVIIAVAALIGALGACAFAGFTAIVFFTGLSVGLSASGVVTIANRI